MKFQTRKGVEVLLVTYNKGKKDPVLSEGWAKLGVRARSGGNEKSSARRGNIRPWRGSFFWSSTIGINVPHYRSIKAPLTPFKSFPS